MALITWPGLAVRSIAWSLDRPAQINRSAYTGARSVAANPWYARWSAKVALVPIIGEKNVLPVRVFLASLRGAVNTFRLPATEGGQAKFSAATVQTTALKGATSMTIAGCYVRSGHMLTVNDQLILVKDSSPSGVNCAIDFEPALRAQANAGTVVETGNPTCLVALTGSTAGWSVDPGQVYNCSFDVEEVF